jgi:DNA-binding transcriptional regulator PaaX
MSARAARQYLEYKSNGLPRPISQINKNGWVEIKKLNNQILVKITEDGKIAALQIIIARKRKTLPKGQKLLIAFDIPELAKDTRFMFRYSLKKMGFHQIQKSIWGTLYDVTKEMKQYIKFLKIERWVVLFKVLDI